MNDIAQRIRNRRIYLGISPEKMANLAGLSHTAVRQWESGKCEPSLYCIREIAKVLDISVCELIGEERDWDGRHDPLIDPAPAGVPVLVQYRACGDTEGPKKPEYSVGVMSENGVWDVKGESGRELAVLSWRSIPDTTANGN